MELTAELAAKVLALVACETNPTVEVAREARAIARDAAAADAADDAARDEMLTVMAAIGVEALREVDSPGCQWLSLCDAQTRMGEGE